MIQIRQPDIITSHIGEPDQPRHFKPRTPARCERCSAWLSQYRGAHDTHCSPCALKLRREREAA